MKRRIEIDRKYHIILRLTPIDYKLIITAWTSALSKNYQNALSVLLVLPTHSAISVFHVSP